MYMIAGARRVKLAFLTVPEALYALPVEVMIMPLDKSLQIGLSCESTYLHTVLL